MKAKSGFIAKFALAVMFGAAVGGGPVIADAAQDRPGAGQTAPSTTVYAGISPDRHEPMFTTPSDAPGTYRWSDAMAYCAALEIDGHRDWRVPTRGELDEMFRNRAAIGGFNASGSDAVGWYWSSSKNFSDLAWKERFSDGVFGHGNRNDLSSLRCVR